MSTKTKTKPKPQLRADLTTSRKQVDFSALRSIAEKYPNQFMARFEDLAARGEITIGTLGSIRGLFRALLDAKVEARVDIAGETRSVMTSAFPLAMGSLMVAALNSAYDSVPSVMDELVTDMESNKKFTHIAKLHHEVHDKVDVAEGEEFPLIRAGESFTLIGHKRRGFRWQVTQETFEEDDVGALALFLDEAGKYAAELNEELGLDRVTDRYGSADTPVSPYAYQPGGAGTALFVAAGVHAQLPQGSRVINNEIVDETDLENIRRVLVSQLNTRGRRVSLPLNSEGILLSPDALAGRLSTITGSEDIPGQVGARNPWGPKGSYHPKVLVSPKLDDLSTKRVYMGFPKRVFIRKHKLRVETVSVYNDPIEFLRSRAAYEGRVAWDQEIGARDNVGWVESLPGANRAAG